MSGTEEVDKRRPSDATPIIARLYSGREDGVVVRECGTTRSLPLPAAAYFGSKERHNSPKGRLLAIALLKDALEDEARAVELADTFNSRVISILPDRWTMTRERILSYTDVMLREKADASVLAAVSTPLT